MSKNKIIEQIENAQLKTDLPEFGPGDTVIVQVRVREGTRERLQAYEGVVTQPGTNRRERRTPLRRTGRLLPRDLG